MCNVLTWLERPFVWAAGITNLAKTMTIAQPRGWLPTKIKGLFMDMQRGFIHLDKDREKGLATWRKRLAKAQKLVRRKIGPNVSLVDELIAERREAARRE